MTEISNCVANTEKTVTLNIRDHELVVQGESNNHTPEPLHTAADNDETNRDSNTQHDIFSGRNEAIDTLALNSPRN